MNPTTPASLINPIPASQGSSSVIPYSQTPNTSMWQGAHASGAGGNQELNQPRHLETTATAQSPANYSSPYCYKVTCSFWNRLESSTFSSSYDYLYHRNLNHYLHNTFPPGTSVDAFIPKAYVSLEYTTIYEIYDAIVAAGKGCYNVKKDMADAFRNTPLSRLPYWLFSFKWQDCSYTETCLSFGLSTAPFLFKLFAEAFHWMLASYLGWCVKHYLDDFIRTIPPASVNETFLDRVEQDYYELIQLLGVPRNDKQDNHESARGHIVTILGIEVDTILLEARLPQGKVAKAQKLTIAALHRTTLSIHDSDELSGFLNFCAKVTPLGRLYLHHLWLFIASFPQESSQQTRRAVPRDLRLDVA
ncbi:hypothetical protein K3495_g11978 [Podosphaera aphanis]|nr:hypothetical protein K3495_g11978 [Podosphaera aphanis]